MTDKLTNSKLYLFLYTMKEYQRFSGELCSHELTADYDAESYVQINTKLILLRKYGSKGEPVFIEEILDEMKKTYPHKSEEASKILNEYHEIINMQIEQILADGTKLNLYQTIEDVMYGLYLHADANRIQRLVQTDRLFLLSKEDAINTVFEKLGVLFRLILSASHNNVMEYIKEKVKTNSVNISEIDFIQESLKWICRWSSKYCAEQSENKVKISAEEIYELMGMAYSYEQFYRMWQLHNKQIVKFRQFGNKLEFTYCNEETYMVHVAYDTYIRKQDEYKELQNVLASSCKKKDLELIEQVHKSDFELGINFIFDGFDLNDYEIFSTALSNYIMMKITNSNLIIPGVEGIIKLRKEEWIELIGSLCDLGREKIVSIIEFFTYNYEDINADLSLTYFLPSKDNFLLLSEGIFNIQRPAVNALRILAKRQNKAYEKEQNRFEDIQKKKIIDKINSKYLVAKNITREQQIRPGMDAIVYDKEKKHLQVIELKYKLPIESTSDLINLDAMLNKAYNQIKIAEEMVEENKTFILEEYFGESFKGIIPDFVDYFVITNYSVGTGRNCILPSPIILESHYLSMMKLNNGMYNVHYALSDNGKGYIQHVEKRYARYLLSGYKIMVPEYLFKINAPRL